MEKHRAIPQGYMTVGEIAKKMDITVRTMQYYDKEGLLSPSAESEGGRRLYTDKDMITLHQILSMKHLGFSLEYIKSRLLSLDTPADVAHALTEHGAAIREKIAVLSESLSAIDALKEEVLQMQTVHFKKYADIIVNLQMKNEGYWIIKHMDDDVLDHVRSRFTKESGAKMMDTFNRLYRKAADLKGRGVSPESKLGLEFAKEYWDMVMEFTGGDMSILSKLLEIPGKMDGERKKQQETANAFIEPALDAYFTKHGINPFEGDASL